MIMEPCDNTICWVAEILKLLEDYVEVQSHSI